MSDSNLILKFSIFSCFSHNLSYKFYLAITMSNQATFISDFQQFLAVKESKKDVQPRQVSDAIIPESPTEPSKY